MIIDTTVIIDLLRNNKETVNKIQNLLENGETLFISALTVFELFSGIAQSKKSYNEKEKVESILKGQPILDINRHIAEKAGIIDGTLAKRGRKIVPVDSMIAGTALLRNEKILTRDRRHFNRVDGLTVIEY